MFKKLQISSFVFCLLMSDAFAQVANNEVIAANSGLRFATSIEQGSNDTQSDSSQKIRSINNFGDLQSNNGDAAFNSKRFALSNKIALPENEFQKFVSQSVGKKIPLFGADFFAGSSTPNFDPVQNAPVPSDYPLGVGDEVLIRGWGTLDINVRAVIDRHGAVTVPTVGSISLVGTKAGDAENVVKQAIDRVYKGVNVSVTMGRLKAISIYVVGQARFPGSYTVSSFSTAVTALFASGGPNENGSLRRVQVKRQGKVVADLDLYAFIARGDKSADVHLQNGDTIFIPAAIGYVGVTGKVNLPAIYELRSESDTLESILQLAGGIPVIADPRRVFLERIDPTKPLPRSVEEFSLDDKSLQKTLKSGDILSVVSITPDFSNAVTLRGNVDQPIRAAFKPGMHVSDLIPSKDFLLTRVSIEHRNSTNLEVDREAKQKETTEQLKAGNADKVSKEKLKEISAEIGNSVDDINWEYASIERLNRNTLSVQLITFHLANALDVPSSPDNIELQAGDIVTIFSQNDIRLPLDKRKVFVRIEGEVNAPGVYQLSRNEGLQDLISRAGGTTPNAYLFGTEFYREQVRKAQEANLEKITSRLESRIRSEQLRSTQNQSITSPADAQLAELKKQGALQAGQEALNRIKTLKPTGRIAFSISPKETSFSKLPKLKLENGDQLVIPSIPDFVHVFGSVNQESSFLWEKGLTVGKYLHRAGPTSEADLDNVFVLRADGTVLSNQSSSWFSSTSGIEVMPGDSIVIPEKFDKETAFTRFTSGLKDWAQIFSGLGLGAAAIKTLK